MPKHNKPKFKVGQEVVYHEGNWKLRVQEIYWDAGGSPIYHCACNEEDDVCEVCSSDFQHTNVYDEADLMDYDEWCDHTEKQDCETCCN